MNASCISLHQPPPPSPPPPPPLLPPAQVKSTLDSCDDDLNLGEAGE